MTNGTVFIYAVGDPRTDEIRYVGKTNNLSNRAKAHRCAAAKGARTRLYNWYREMTAQGVSPDITVLEECTEATCQEAEQFWISNLRYLGCVLTNHTSGGEGGYQFDPATRARMKQKAQARWSAPDAYEKARASGFFNDGSRRRRKEWGPLDVAGAIARRKRFILTDPKGNEIEVVGLAPFCKSHGLNAGNFYNVLSGKRKTVAGWKVRRA